MRKVFSKTSVAIENLSFALPHSACFGLLGTNSAGKTTTMKILTGETTSTNGNAYINGTDVFENQYSIRKMIGYCPQSDPLIELLTIREHLELFARLEVKSVFRIGCTKWNNK